MTGPDRRVSIRVARNSFPAGAGIVADDGQQGGVPDGAFLFAAAKHFPGDGGRLEGKSIAPAANP
ncbi:hypothetical protein AB9E06_36440 [Rhizobium leguminosarum]|uniref:hypothetical protein n=1 Tax=Rhizobium leguminosarum TaxID=384 RepID=UPI003F987C62